MRQGGSDGRSWNGGAAGEYVYYGDPQDNAGPFALLYAKRRGRDVPWDMDAYERKAKLLSSLPVAWLFGKLAGYPVFTQHINTVFLAHLAAGRKPPQSMRWLWEGNPFYSATAGVKCDVAYPLIHRMTRGHTKRMTRHVPLCNRKPSSWPFRGHPFDTYILSGVPIPDEEYTPIWQVIADALQGEL